MGETSVILEGIENHQALLSLYSTIHGAGRVMGRMEAKESSPEQGPGIREDMTRRMGKGWRRCPRASR
jgi:tRNA-splicing ligase RtcB